MNVGGEHVIVRSEVVVPGAGAHRLGVRVRRLTHVENPTPQTGPGTSEITLLIDGAPVGAHRDEVWLTELHLLVRPRHRP